MTGAIFFGDETYNVSFMSEKTKEVITRHLMRKTNDSRNSETIRVVADLLYSTRWRGRFERRASTPYEMFPLEFSECTNYTIIEKLSISLAYVEMEFRKTISLQ